MDQSIDLAWSQRAAQNQSLFREVNERLREAMETTTLVDFVCECADVACSERVPMSLDEYERVRAEPKTFAVKAGHVYPDVEWVVNQNDRYSVVEKIGEAGEAAQTLDPRTRQPA